MERVCYYFKKHTDMLSLLCTMMQMQLMYVKTVHLLEVSCGKYKDM
jgi:hypothetical protein